MSAVPSNRGDSPLPVGVLDRIDAICAEFERAWQAADSPRIEDFLACLDGAELDGAEPVARRRLLQELLAVELEFRDGAGQSPTAADYRLRFSDAIDVVEAACADLARRKAQSDSASPSIASTYIAPAAEVPPVEFPAAIGRYRVIERLSGGGQAEVFRVVHPQLPGRDLVVKWARKHLDAGQQQKLIEEGQLLADLDDPGLVRLHDVDVYRGRPFVVLECVAGRQLRDVIHNARPSPRESARLTAALARTLAVVHRKGVIHRDLKPSNILIDAGGRPRILDFGLATAQRLWEDERPSDDAIAGTLAYMAPEQARGQGHRIGPWTDVFGLGAVFYELLTGQPPYCAQDADSLFRQAREGQIRPPRELNPRIPRRLDRICRKALASEPDARYGSAAEVEAALRRYGYRRWAGSAALVLVFVMAGLWLWLSRAEELPPLEGTATFRVWRDEHIAGQQFGDAGVLPLRAGDKIRIEARLNRPSYVYLVWIDTEGVASPVYPWRGDEWTNRPSRELKVAALSLPSHDPQAGFRMRAGAAGIETLVLLARDSPLTAENERQLRSILAALPTPPHGDAREFIWLNGTRMTGRPDTDLPGGKWDPRAPDLKLPVPIEEPVLKTHKSLVRQLGSQFTLIEAWSFGTGGA